MEIKSFKKKAPNGGTLKKVFTQYSWGISIKSAIFYPDGKYKVLRVLNKPNDEIESYINSHKQTLKGYKED